MAFDVQIHARSFRVERFWPGNSNQITLEFTPRAFQQEVTRFDMWLEDAARAWEIYDALKDETTVFEGDEELERLKFVESLSKAEAA